MATVSIRSFSAVSVRARYSLIAEVVALTADPIGIQTPSSNGSRIFCRVNHRFVLLAALTASSPALLANRCCIRVAVFRNSHSEPRCIGLIRALFLSVLSLAQSRSY